MRILHVITDLEVGGAEIMLARLVEHMDRSRFENVVVSMTGEGALVDRIRAAGVSVHALGMRRGVPSLGGFMRLFRLLRTLKPALVQSWLYHADLLATLAALFAGGVPVVWNVRCADMDMSRYSWLSRAVLRLLALCSPFPAAVVVNSERGRATHEGIGYHPARWELIENGFDPDRFRPDAAAREAFRAELGCTDDAVVVALAARVDPMKDHATFLAAAAQVAVARPHSRFVLIGGGTSSLRDVTERLGIADRCHLLGERSEIHRLLPGMDIVALSSISEGFPNVLGEAMACGVPCVSTDVGDAAHIVGDTGLMVSPRDSEALAKAVIDLIDRGAQARTELGRRARQRIMEHFALQDAVRRYQALYDEVAVSSATG